MNSLFRDYEIIVRSGLFDPTHYLALYPDVARRNVDPLIHYLEEGAQAARSPHPDFDAEFYLVQCHRHGHKPENPLLHYLTVGVGLGFKAKPHAATAPQPRDDGQAPKEEWERAAAPVFGRPPVQLHIDEASVGRKSGDHIDEVILPVLAVPRAADPEVAPIIAGAPGRELTLDTPVLAGGVMETPVRGNLEIGGWALARAGVAAIEIAVDDQVLMSADYGLRRLDVLSVFPDWDNSLESGFLALLSQRMLPRGLRRITVTLRDKVGGTTALDFRVIVEPPSVDAGPGMLRRQMPAAELDLGRRLLAARDWRPTFQVLVVIDADTRLDDIRLTVASLQSQVYEHWRLELVRERGRSVDDLTRERLVDEFAALGEQCRLLRSDADVTIDEAAFVAVLSPGSKLGCDALHEMALATASHRETDFFYSDERRANPATGEVEAFFKPQWSPDLLLSTNYVGQLWCARGDLVRRVAAAGGLPLTEPYDLVLRLTEAAQTIRHVPSVLCEGAPVPRDRSEQETRALDAAAVRRGIPAEAQPGLVAGTYRFRRGRAGDGLVSIIIPTRAAEGMIARCIETIRTHTTDGDFEIVCIENIPPADAYWRSWLETHADRVLSGGETFNWSRFNNRGVAAARGEYLLFLNDDIEVVDPDWLGVLVEQAQRPEVGIVGPMLLYPDQRIQHAGMFLAAMGQARHAFRYGRADDPGYFGLALTERNVIAVTGACLMTRRDVFERLGGFDEAHDIVNNDLDYCLRVRQAGLSTVYTPHTRLIHHEAVSRASMEDAFDVAAFDSKWRDLFLRGDPFFSPHLRKTQDAAAPDDEPNRLVVTGGPALRRDEIKKILVVKLDHLGDCIMAFPAIRRLQAHFPGSRITVLTSRAARPVWAMEPTVAATIEFDFFRSRSSLAQLALSDDDWRHLHERLPPEGFDLAIDLRRHLETRPVLQHTGARYLAGVDYQGRFPWLDVAVEWTGDPAFAHKRQHAVDDLINLVDAVAAACETGPKLITAPTAPPSPMLEDLLVPLLARPLICIHPAAGNEMKQWPVEYFAAVGDRLVEDHDAQIVLIGGPGEEPIGDDLLRHMRRDGAVSLIGRFPLSDLPALLTRCDLFLGNDSGPKHIAAGLGVPTVAVHSGSVDVYEWGPVGPRAVAVVRDVTCAPCYLPTPQHCRRGLACLRQLTPDAVYAACEKMLLATAGGGFANDHAAPAVDGPPS